MSQPNGHNSCKGTNSCHQIFEQLEKGKTPSNTPKMAIMFMLPLAIFVVALVISSVIFEHLAIAGQLRSGLSFLISLLTTFIIMWIGRSVHRRVSTNK